MTVVIHQSSASVASDCLARYEVECRHGRGNVNTDGLYSSIGTAVHAAIEAGYHGTATGNREPLDCALDGLDAWWAKNGDALPVRVKAEAETLLRGAYSEESNIWLRLPGRGQQVSVEHEWAMDEEFRAVPVGDPSAAYSGTIDYVEWGPKGLILRDHKTSLVMHKSADLVHDTQGWLYSLWALAQWQFPSVSWGLNMIRHGYTARHEFKRGDPWMRQAKRYYTAVRAHVLRAESSGEWPASVGAGCAWCPIRHKCSALSAAIEQGSVCADSEPEAVARLYLAAKGIASQAERDARKCAEDGPIPVGVGKVLGFKPGTRDEWSSPLVNILEQLRTDGASDEDLAEWFPGASVSKAALEGAAKVLVKRGELEQAPHEYVALFRESRPSVTFTTWAQGEEVHASLAPAE